MHGIISKKKLPWGKVKKFHEFHLCCHFACQFATKLANQVAMVSILYFDQG
jgi:hypothetical protein